MADAKSGPEIVKEFFESMGSVSGLDAEVVRMLTELQGEGKLSSKNISNALEALRKKLLDGES